MQSNGNITKIGQKRSPMVCQWAGGERDGRGSCGGDKGGPLQISSQGEYRVRHGE